MASSDGWDLFGDDEASAAPEPSAGGAPGLPCEETARSIRLQVLRARSLILKLVLNVAPATSADLRSAGATWTSCADRLDAARALLERGEAEDARLVDTARSVADEAYGHCVSNGSWTHPAQRELFCLASAMAALAFCAGGSPGGADADAAVTRAMYYVDVATVLGLPAEVSQALSAAVESLLRSRCILAVSFDKDCSNELGKCATLSWPMVGEAPSMTGVAVESLQRDALPFDIFERSYLSKDAVTIRGLARDWLAFEEFAGVDGLKRLARMHGHRTVPIELRDGEDRLSEKLMLLRDFIDQRLLVQSIGGETAYLAQHDLFAQIPALKDLIKTPVYCGNEPSVVNAWLGTGGTVTRAHFDSYDNIFVQLTGRKYVRLVSPDQGHLMYRVARNSKGSNKRARLDTSGNAATTGSDADSGANKAASGDCDELAQGNMSAVSNLEDYDRERFPLLAEARFSEVILEAGDALYIPAGTWHYVRSLSTSFSVSFWF